MHIALDASDLGNSRLDGVTIYARELLPRLADFLLARGHTVTAYSRQPVGDNTFPRAAKMRLEVIPGKRFWTQTTLSRALFRSRPDLLFLPVQTVPLYRPRALKVVATVHDLDFFDYPEMYDLKNRLLLRWFTRVVARNATRIIAVSAATQAALLSRYGRRKEDVIVVHHGCDGRRFAPAATPEQQREACRDIQQRYGIPELPLLFVGALQPRKNLQGLLAAFELLRGKGRTEDLVIVCGNAWKERDLLQRIAASQYHENIHVLHRVPPEDLPAIYWNASVFVLPSFSEGFGLPVLEALACGTPAVVSAVPALTEIAGDAAVAVSPHDPSAIALAVERFLKDPELRRAHIEQGLKRAASFSWDRTAKATAAVIEQAL